MGRPRRQQSTGAFGLISLPRFAYSDVCEVAVRLALGSVFLYAGLAKALHESEAVLAVRGYELLPDLLLWPVALGFAWLEIALGALLLLGLWSRFAAVGAAVLSAVFLIALVQARVRGLQISCGCFGGDGQGTGVAWLDLLREPPLLAAASFLARRRCGPLRLDQLLEREPGAGWWMKARRKGSIALIAAIVIASFAVPILGGWGGAAAAADDAVRITSPSRSSLIPAGRSFPDFTAPALGGGTISWPAYRGTPAVVVVWAPWCPNCQKELPLLSRLAREFPGIRLVGIVTGVDGTSPTPTGFMKSHGLDFPVAIDSKSERLADALGVEGFPTVYFVTRAGTVHQVATGAAPEAVLRSLMSEIAG
jgi:thiol-disulfide isomerase/thioredoxin/uncharacterized membrane protein YphA (DoxX/SURF4 family)